ncbi:MAG: MBG domain-containing protein, partial [Verrucomicrobia bacterium]|nr:MBG domain-containing protein [Verrucomicrobiota bacterium]
SYNGGNSTTANRAASLLAFSNFVTAADIKGINVILDAPFNHTAYDCEISSQGLPLFAEAGLNTSGWSATDKIKDRDARFYSTKGATGIVYSAPANSASDIAPAPDRNDFGKWADVIDVFFGRYATLVTGDPIADVSRATVANEGDWITISDLQGGAGSNGAVTRAVWKYFARYVPYWLEKTGLPAGSSKEDQAYKGIDGLRADFGQGMPPQFWEYVINVARTHKWNFIFMTESLDGGAVTYRSNRHFDLLNENIVFPWQSATNTSGHQAIFETRRTSYGQGLVLLNNTSHDEAGYSDPWQAFIRYAVGSTVDGAPMIMYGQEIGTSATLSFDNYELNFGKLIPHFKKWNSMQPQWNAWGSNSFGVKNLMPAYSGAGLAREFSPALRSSGRWFLNPTGSNDPDQRIFAVAKYEEANASPANKDVVLAFVNLDRSNVAANNFAIPSGLGSLLGIQSGRTYNVRNIAAYLGPNNEYPNRRNSYLWPTARTGADILTNGIYVSLAAVPTNDATWATTPFEAQYLKLYDVSTPTLSFSPPSTGTYETTLTLSSSNNASAAVTYSLVGGNTNKVSLAGTQLTFNSGTGSVTVRATITETANYLGTSADATITFAKATGGITLGNLTQTEGFVTAVTATTAPLGMGTVITYNGSASVPSLPNTYSVLASLSDENYQGSNSGTLTIVAAGPSFVSSFPGVTATSDSDHDGVSALLEYTLGGSTNSNDIGLLPVLTSSGSILRLTAVVRTNDPTLIIGAEAVTNLTGTWSSVNISTNTSNQTGVSAGFQRREYDFDAGTNSRAFLRLRVTQP